MESVSGKTAFITGGASGIGFGIAEALVAAGVKVAIADVDLELYSITHPEFREMVEQRCSNLLDHFGESADPDLPRNPDWRDLV